MGKGRNWSAREKDILSEEWGQYSIPEIAKHLDRSENAIIIKAQRMNLGAHLASSQYVSLNVLCQALGIDYHFAKTFESAGLKIRRHRIKTKTVKVVDVDEFWLFAGNNRHLLDFSKFEAGALGKEPDWVQIKRLEDFSRGQRIKPHNQKWTEAEDKELLRLLQTFKYSYLEISEKLHRTEGAIQRRVVDLKIKERPIKADNHTLWTHEELYCICELIKNGSNYENISRIIGKSAKAIRGKVYSEYLTENLSKVINIIKDGSWGDNRPERRISQRNLMTIEEKETVKNHLSELCGLLAYKVREQFDTQDNWQKSLCKNWDEIKGCLSGEFDCDSCSSFERIRPQYCARCGATFLERKENRMCFSCRQQRKKQGFKKYIRNLNRPSGKIFN